MTQKLLHKNVVEDFKSTNGNWIKSFSVEGVHKKTRGFILWTSVNARCNPNGSAQKNNLRYIGSENLFNDYNSFIDWCHDQYGYMSKDENGRFWSLDKDLLEFGNKHYSPDKCLFVPQRLNNLLVSSNKVRGEYPVGVYLDIKKNSIVALGSDGRGRTKYLGSFKCPYEAHRAWQKDKMEKILLEAESQDWGGRIKEALLYNYKRIQKDYWNNLETIPL